MKPGPDESSLNFAVRNDDNNGSAELRAEDGRAESATDGAKMPQDPKNSLSLLRRIATIGADDPAFWSFRHGARRDLSHAFFQYPAMMVPRMLGEILARAADQLARHATVADPFVGSGTTLVESMKLGFKFSGMDINPLAILICQSKSIPHNCDALSQVVAETLRRASADRSRCLESDFPSLRKWFSLTTAIRLSRLRRAIRRVSERWARRFLWVALAETVRLTSNSRTTTFKLHIRPADEITARNTDPLKAFSEVAVRNVSRLKDQCQLLSQRQLLKGHEYIHDITLTLGDVRSHIPGKSQAKRADFLITSPPYGDNVSTVTYGQHSYLPLQWIDLEDIDHRIDQSVLRTTHEIDSRSLGGSRRVSAQEVTTLRTLSPTFAKTLLRLQTQPRDRQQRIAAFYRDLVAALPSLVSLVTPSAPMIWIVGNRYVGGQEVPMNRIFEELLEAYGCTVCETLNRQIPSKRIAFINSVSNTVQKEHIILSLSPKPKFNRATS